MILRTIRTTPIIPWYNTVVEIPVEYDGSSPNLKVMICWSDPAYHEETAAPFTSGVMNPELGPYDLATQRLVNDVDLTVVGPDGTTHRPWILNPAAPLEPARFAGAGETNTRDNVEQVVIKQPVAGEYLIRVTHKDRLFQLSPVDPNLSEHSDDFALETGAGQAISVAVSGNEIGSFKRPELEFVPGSPSETAILTLATFYVKGFVGLRYQMQRSADLETWVNVDAPFHLSQSVEIKTAAHTIEDGQFYRVREISPTNN